MKPLVRIILLCLITASISLGVALATVQAQTPPILQGEGSAKGIGTQSESTLTLAQCQKDGNCSIEHILLLANSIIRWAVAISGSIALLMYVLGGVWMIFSQGNSSRIERGKDIIVGTSISLIFILGGWLIIQFALTSLGAKDKYLLQQNNCGTGGQCPNGLICSDKNKCVELCARDKAEIDTAHPWQCQDLSACGLTACIGDNCVKNKCLSRPTDLNYVCCWKP